MANYNFKTPPRFHLGCKPKRHLEDELIGLKGIISKNQGAKQVAYLKSIQAQARAWSITISKHHQGFI
jgi:hypothetical protein